VETARETADEDLLVEVAHAFYAQHPDEYDMLVLWGAAGLGPTSSYYAPVRNDVGGIGYEHVGPELFNRSGDFGSLRLQGIIWMGPDWRTNQGLGTRSVLGILAQETGHRWGSSVYFQSASTKDGASSDLLANPYHWSFFFDSGASPLGGNDWQWVDEDRFLASPVTEVTFCRLDLYLMGLIGADAVGPLLLLTNLRDDAGLPSSMFTRASRRVTHPVTVRATPLTIPIEAITAIEGPRDQGVGFDARHIRQAWIHVGPGAPSPADIERLKALQSEWDGFFRQATGGLSLMSSAL
jgi:hypothetical protein